MCVIRLSSATRLAEAELQVEAGPAMTQDDQHLSRAIEASLSSSMEDMTNVEYDVVPDAEALRNDIR